ncbi:MAG: ArnT family glycosyltransferase, partial [Planctomycetales bacterium]
MPSQLRQGVLLTGIAALAFFIGLGSTHLWDDDETYFAGVAQEMAARGDWIVPWFNDRLFSHKPPFMFWMMIGAFRLFGVSEFAARLPSALFGIANVLLIWRLGRLLYSPRVGFWGGLVLATSLNFAVIARAATCDAELVFFCTLPLYLFARGFAPLRSSQDESFTEVSNTAAGPHSASAIPSSKSQEQGNAQRPNWGTFALLYASMGMAVLVKGPIGVLLPTTVLGLYWLLQRTGSGALSARSSAQPEIVGNGRRGIVRELWRRLVPRQILQTIWSLRPITALAAVLVVAGPWFVAVSLKTDGEFLQGFFGVHHFGRFLKPMDNHAGPIWFYLAAVCVGFFPWAIFFTPTFVQWYRRLRSGDPWSQADLLCGVWFVVWFGFFSLASTKFPHYIVPAYPALSLVTAAFLDRWMSSGAIYGRLAGRGAWVTIGIVGIGILVVVPLLQRHYLHEIGYAGLAGLPLLVAAAVGAYFTERDRVGPALAWLSGSTVAFLLLLFAFAAPEVDRHQNSEFLADSIRAHAGANRPKIAHFHYYRPGLTYYCR